MLVPKKFTKLKPSKAGSKSIRKQGRSYKNSNGIFWETVKRRRKNG